MAAGGGSEADARKKKTRGREPLGPPGPFFLTPAVNPRIAQHFISRGFLSEKKTGGVGRGFGRGPSIRHKKAGRPGRARLNLQKVSFENFFDHPPRCVIIDGASPGFLHFHFFFFLFFFFSFFRRGRGTGRRGAAVSSGAEGGNREEAGGGTAGFTVGGADKKKAIIFYFYFYAVWGWGGGFRF